MSHFPIERISPEAAARERASRGAIPLLDVRSPAEYGAEHAEGAVSVPLDSLDPQALERHLGTHPPASDERLHVICQAGPRAMRAAEQLVAAGHRNVAVIEGGTRAWVAAGLPHVQGRKAVSLERQVQIAVGVALWLVMAIGLVVHPAFFALVAVIGTGLIYAGATCNCLLTHVLARMPWNRAAAA